VQIFFRKEDMYDVIDFLELFSVRIIYKVYIYVYFKNESNRWSRGKSKYLKGNIL